MRTWADAAGVVPPARSIDRDQGEGPPRCCARRLVSADSLICYDDVSAELLSVLVTRFPHLEKAEQIFLCDACAETLIREHLITREDRARVFGLSEKLIAKAWLHDEESRHRGPDAAPPEVRGQPWWPEYESMCAARLALDDPKDAALAEARWRGDVQALLRQYNWSSRSTGAASG